MKNIYKIINLPHDASTQQIQNALRKCAEKQALDIETIKKIRQILLDPATRQRYDQKLRVHDPDFFAPKPPPAPKQPRSKLDFINQFKGKNGKQLIQQLMTHSPLYYSISGLMMLISVLMLPTSILTMLKKDWIVLFVSIIIGISTAYAFWVLKKYADKLAKQNKENISQIKRLVYFSMLGLPILLGVVFAVESEKSKNNTITYQEEQFEEESDWESWDNYKLPLPIDFSYESTTQYEILYLKPISDNVYDVVSTQTFKSSGSIYYDKSRINCNKQTYQYIANEEQLVPVLKRKIKQDAQENYATEGSAYHKIRAICR